MTATENLRAAIVAAFAIKDETDGKESPEVIADAVTGILVAFAEVVRGPATTTHGIEAVAETGQADLVDAIKELTCEIKALRDELTAITACDGAAVLNTAVS